MRTPLLSCILSLGLLSCGGVAPGADGQQDPAEAVQRLLSGSPAAQAAFDPDHTVTVYLHGWNLKGSVSKGTVGEDTSGGSMVAGIVHYSGLPLGTTDPTAPNQIVGTEYYGDTFPSYYTAQDVADFKGLSGIPRYALIAGKYVRHVLGRSGAVAANLTCHSMGCEISRYLIENDVEHLASDHLLGRWASFSGVVNGAALASIDSKNLNLLALLLGLNLVDVQDMTYTWVEANVAAFDHQRVNGDNPNFGGMILHHIQSTNPKVDTALDIPLLDAFGHGAQPNDGILLDEEQYLHAQSADAELRLPSGDLVGVSTSHHYADHFQITDVAGAQAVAAAALVGARRVRVTLSSVTLIKDLLGGPLHHPPAKIAIESNVDYPYLATIDSTSPLIDEVAIKRRNAPVVQVAAGQTVSPEVVVYYGPVFAPQTTVHLAVTLTETDYYPAGGVKDNPLAPRKTLATLDQEVPLVAGTYQGSSANAQFTLEVAVEQLY